MNSVIQNAKRLIIKVGSSLVTNDGHGLDHAAIGKWSEQIAKLHLQGKEIILVSSGAIAEGMLQLGFKKRPVDIHELQACAAVGQMGLVQIYQTSFETHGLHTAQVLLTHADLTDRERYLNARSTLFTLLRFGVIPIINENDTVATHEIEICDNDTLSAIVASMIGADLLILLSDIDGLYTDDPRANPDAEFIETVEHLDESFLRMGKSTTGSGVGTGGMSTKLTAATIATASGADMVIANSKDVRIIHRIIDGENYGTLFLAEKQDAFDLPDFVENLHSCRERA